MNLIYVIFAKDNSGFEMIPMLFSLELCKFYKCHKKTPSIFSYYHKV